MAALLILVALFNVLKYPYLLLICLMLFLFIYQISLGTYFFTYVAVVGNPSINTIGSATTWFLVLIVSTITPFIISGFGVTITFLIYAATGLCGTTYLFFFMKNIDGLSKEELTLLYAPSGMKKLYAPELLDNLNKTGNTTIPSFIS